MRQLKATKHIFEECQLVDNDTLSLGLLKDLAKAELNQWSTIPPTDDEVKKHMYTILAVRLLPANSQLYSWLGEIGAVRYGKRDTFYRVARGGVVTNRGLYFIQRHNRWADIDLLHGTGNDACTNAIVNQINEGTQNMFNNEEPELLKADINRSKGLLAKDNGNKYSDVQFWSGVAWSTFFGN